MKKNNKGFTLMEMLIVVAIIAVLVAIMIPTLTTQLEKARETADIANIRSAYAEAMVKYLNGETDGVGKTTVTVETPEMTQTTAGFDKVEVPEYLENAATNNNVCALDSAKKGVTFDVQVAADGVVTISVAD